MSVHPCCVPGEWHQPPSVLPLVCQVSQGVVWPGGGQGGGEGGNTASGGEGVILVQALQLVVWPSVREDLVSEVQQRQLRKGGVLGAPEVERDCWQCDGRSQGHQSS